MTRRARLLILAGFTLAVVAVTLILPPIPQDQAYHNFADQRTWLSIPNCLDVLSNIPFILVGTWGLSFLWRQRQAHARTAFAETSEMVPYAVFFSGVALTGFGSAYYHLEPNNATLTWDRLPLALVFTAFFAAMVAERISLKAGLALLLPLVILGINSVIYWNLSELRGLGDLRLYLVVQFYPLLAVPLIILLFPARYSRSADLWGTVAFYAAAKVFEVFDAGIFFLGQIVSGHTLKHCAAATALYWLLRMLRMRHPLG